MLRIYLDHKDYQNIAKGLRGDSRWANEAAAYHELRDWVTNGKVRCYYSWAHLTEVVRWGSEDQEAIQAYCEALETLTAGHCIVWQQDLERREFLAFMKSTFAVGKPHEDLEPFGVRLAAFPNLDDQLAECCHTFNAYSNRRVHEALRERGMSRNDRRRMTKEVPVASETASIDPDEVRASLPGMEVALAGDGLKRFLNGSFASRMEILRTGFREAATFEHFLNFYRYHFPAVRDFGTVFDAAANQLLRLIALDRLAAASGGANDTVDLDALRETLTDRSARYWGDQTYKLTKGGSRKDVVRVLKAEKLSQIPTWDAAICIAIEYARSNAGKSNRNLKESDLRDMLHFRYAPYVDYFSTDRYFSVLSKPVADRFGTKVFRSVTELVKDVSSRM